MRFAIVGTNFVSDSFMKGALLCKDCEVVAVCSKSPENAEAFAKKYGIPKVFADSDEMLGWGDFDAVYVATPNSTHKEISEKFLRAKRHVFCEKPMAGSYDEVVSLVKTARENGVYLHEGLVPLFSENFRIIKDSLGLVGRVRQVNINMSQYSTRYDAYLRGEEPTTFKCELCNGAVMDLGVYLLALTLALFGEPKEAHGASVMLESGVDASTSMMLCYGDFIADLVCSKVCDSENLFEICGEDGTLVMDHPTKFTSIVYKSKKKGVFRELAVRGENLFYYEINEMIERIANGKTESESVPLELSLSLHKLLTDIRKKTGVIFPCDE